MMIQIASNRISGEDRNSKEPTFETNEDSIKNHNITKVDQVDLSTYNYTNEESRSVVRKLDLHVSL